jgi:hypothetical protein
MEKIFKEVRNKEVDDDTLKSKILQNKNDINAKSSYSFNGSTLLSIFVERENIEMVKFLLKNGALIEKDNYRVVKIAIIKKNVEIIKKLVDNIIDIDHESTSDEIKRYKNIRKKIWEFCWSSQDNLEDNLEILPNFIEKFSFESDQYEYFAKKNSINRYEFKTLGVIYYFFLELLRLNLHSKNSPLIKSMLRPFLRRSMKWLQTLQI